VFQEDFNHVILTFRGDLRSDGSVDPSFAGEASENFTSEAWNMAREMAKGRVESTVPQGSRTTASIGSGSPCPSSSPGGTAELASPLSSGERVMLRVGVRLVSFLTKDGMRGFQGICGRGRGEAILELVSPADDGSDPPFKAGAWLTRTHPSEGPFVVVSYKARSKLELPPENRTERLAQKWKVPAEPRGTNLKTLWQDKWAGAPSLV